MSVLEKASELIDCLGQAGEPVSLAYVRSALDMPKSSTHRLLGELAGLGIVRRTDDGRYSLGPRLLYWASRGRDVRPAGRGEPAMRHLRDQVGESVHLYVRERDTRTCIAAVEARHELRRSSSSAVRCRSGRARPASCCWRSRTRTSSDLSCAAPGATRPASPMPRGRDSAASSSRSAPSAGRRPSGSARTAWQRPPRRSSTLASAWVAALCVSGPTTRLNPERLAAMRRPLEGRSGRDQRAAAPRLTALTGQLRAATAGCGRRRRSAPRRRTPGPCRRRRRRSASRRPGAPS